MEAISITAETHLRFTRRDWLIGLLIVLLAFSYRTIIIVDRATAPNGVSAFDPLPQGSDQRTYYGAIKADLVGAFPPKTFFYQPVPFYFMIAISKLMRTDNLGALRIAVAALAALNCGLMVAAARLAFGRKWVSYLSGILLALYPVAAFYDTDFVITSQSTILVTTALFGVLWLWRQPRNWTGAVIFGLSIGVIILMRRELAIIAPVMGLWLLWKVRKWRTLFQVTLAAIVALLVILPVVLHNRAGGADYLITPVGATETYRGNNRDADGTYGGRQASQTTDVDYLHYLLQDILLVPGRFIELQLHKIGLYLSSSEPGNNLNYVISGENISPALALNPLNFTLLLVLFLLGIWAGLKQHQAAVWLLGLIFLTIMVSGLIVWIEARLRTPVVVVMIPAAAYGIVYVWEQIPKIWRQLADHQSLGGEILKWVFPAVMIALVLLFSDWAVQQLPHSLTVPDLPPSAHATNIVYDNTLEFVGWQVQEQYSRAGIIQPFYPYVVSLYWKLLKPATIDYSFSLADYVDGQRVLGFDYPIGLVAYPDHPTSAWNTDTIYVEHVGLTYKRFDGLVNVTGELLLFVYPERDAEALLPAAGLDGNPTYVRLT